MTIENVIIIGSGPAGSTAALYTARAELSPIVLHGLMPGGQLTTTTDVENYPGFKDGIDGFSLVMTLQHQAERFGAKYLNHTLESISKENGIFTLKTTGSETFQTKAVIIATGASARYLGLENEERLKNHGVSGCATCDGAFFRDVPIVVVGGGDTAMEEALFLTRFASKVYVVHRRDEFRASKVMIQRVLENDKIEVLWNSQVTDVFGENKVDSVEITSTVTNEKSTVECGAMFLAIGHTPNTKFLQGVVELDSEGYIILKDSQLSHSSAEGIFVAGDCSDHVYRQAVVAAGMGCRAAIDTERWLSEQD